MPNYITNLFFVYLSENIRAIISGTYNMKKLIFIYLIILSFLTVGCSSEKPKTTASKRYIAEMEAWRAKRIKNLKSETGWLNLVGLFWLKEGENTFGSGKSNNIVFPEDMPERIGKFYLKNDTVKVVINDKVNVSINGKNIRNAVLQNDINGKPDILAWKNFRWFIIKRGDRYGVRLRNLNAELVKDFKGIESYPLDEKWKVKAEFIPYSEPKILEIPTIIGTVEEDTAKGYLKFELEGKKFTLDPIDAGEKLFIIFADKTSGKETYGGGRFLYVPKPGSSGNTVIDFNKAYNPPCAFTKYATCPLPPKDNYLSLEVTAGEKNYGHH